MPNIVIGLQDIMQGYPPAAMTTALGRLVFCAVLLTFALLGLLLVSNRRRMQARRTAQRHVPRLPDSDESTPPADSEQSVI